MQAGRRRLAAVAFTARLAGSTDHLLRTADPGSLHDRAARDHGPEQNPMVVVSGLTGSRLIGGDDGQTSPAEPSDRVEDPRRRVMAR